MEGEKHWEIEDANYMDKVVWHHITHVDFDAKEINEAVKVAYMWTSSYVHWNKELPSFGCPNVCCSFLHFSLFHESAHIIPIVSLKFMLELS